MISATTSSSVGSEFDKFLFTPIGEDRNGLPLTVVSLLARMNLDPWQEAGTLAALPAEAAASRLASSLDTLTDPSLRQANPETAVLRLLALLPRQAAVMQTPAASIDTVAGRALKTHLGTIVFIISAIILLGAQILVAHRYTPPQPGTVAAPAVTIKPDQPHP
ncbi:MAG TPA: hypothetical protein VGG49_06740 [Steroidobacteraceae bacterium]|jgi:hypothetical protein